MQFHIEVGGRTRRVAVAREGERFIVTVDGRAWPVSVARVDAHTLSLLIDEGGQLPAPSVVEGKPDTTAMWTSYEVTIVPDRARGQLTVRVGTFSLPVSLNGNPGRSRKDEGGHPVVGPQRVLAAMPGKVARVLVQPGDTVRAGQGVVVLEAMKMENELRALRDGTVTEVHAREGMSIDAGTLLVVIT